jgi:hypothetical protein
MVGHFRWVDEKALVEKHPRIFHYTNFESFKKILETGAIVATEFSKTNDASEGRALRDVISQMFHMRGMKEIRNIFAKYNAEFTGSDEEFERLCRQDAEACHDAMISSVPSKPHITCFSYHADKHHKQNGLLTMWRLYGGRGHGVALGFDTEAMRILTEELIVSHAVDVIYMQDVRYGAEDKIIKQRISDFKSLPELYLRAVAAVVSNESDIFLDAGNDLMNFLELTLAAKHEDFEDEREVRVVTMEAVEQTAANRTRLNRLGENRLLLPLVPALREVIVGPSPDQTAKARRVEKQLEIHGRTDVEIRLTGTPFRQI